MANYTVTVKNKSNASYWHGMTIGRSNVADGNSTHTVEIGTVIKITDIDAVYLNNVKQTLSSYSFLHTVETDVTVEFVGNTAYVTTSSGGSGGSGGKTLIGGTAYSISGGRVLIGGTAYSIDKGKTMVGGTAYEISFSSPVTVSWKGTFHSTYAYVNIENSKYTAKGGPFVYEEPPSISIFVSGSSSKSSCYVKLNGTKVKNGNGTYTFTPDPGTTVVITMSKNTVGYYYAEITMS